MYGHRQFESETSNSCRVPMSPAENELTFGINTRVIFDGKVVQHGCFDVHDINLIIVAID